MAGCIGCGAEVTAGARFCQTCGQPVIAADDGSAAAGVERSTEPPTPGPPPPEGLSLIVAKHRADWEVSHPPETRFRADDEDGWGREEPAASPWRDHDREHGFDLKYALIGAVVVAVAVALAVYWFTAAASDVSSNLGG